MHGAELMPKAKYHASTDAGGQTPSSNFVIKAPGTRGACDLAEGTKSQRPRNLDGL